MNMTKKSTTDIIVDMNETKMQMLENEIVLYQPNDTIHLEVRMANESVWLTQSQIALLFGVKQPAISKHLNNIFKSGELDENSVHSILEYTAADGKLYKTRFYNLDAILSVGYRVNSINATMFRMFDNYVDDTVLTLLDKRADGVSAQIYTRSITQQLALDLQRHNAQYPPVAIDAFQNAHDRFLCIDDMVYHIGASLKDLGKKWFAFSRMELGTDALQAKM